MCIRDSVGNPLHVVAVDDLAQRVGAGRIGHHDVGTVVDQRCLLYTSDAADERSSVDLGGRRLIKKKKTANPVRGGGTKTATNVRINAW